MQQKILSRKILSAVFLAIGIFSLGYIFWPSMRESIQSGIAPAIENIVVLVNPEKVNYGPPTRLRIPAINVDAMVENVGVATNGEMSTPKGPENVAWFMFGPHPGETGSAVIDGHYGWKDNIPAVFDNLKKIQKGDQLLVEDDKGVIVIFIVREIREYDPQANASDVFNSRDGKAHLNLITCDGPWNRVSASRPKRLVVFADKE